MPNLTQTFCESTRLVEESEFLMSVPSRFNEIFGENKLFIK